MYLDPSMPSGSQVTAISYSTQYKFQYEYNTALDRTLSIRVRTVDTSGHNSDWCGPVDIENIVPEKVTGVVATGVLGGVSVSWNPPTQAEYLDAKGFYIYASFSSGNEIYQHYTTTSSCTIVSINGINVKENDVIYIKISEVDGFGEGPLSNEVYATVKGYSL